MSDHRRRAYGLLALHLRGLAEAADLLAQDEGDEEPEGEANAGARAPRRKPQREPYRPARPPTDIEATKAAAALRKLGAA